MTADRFTVQDRPDQQRYVLLDRGEDGTGDAEIGEESYVDVGRDRVLFHTVVSQEYTGQGLASVLVRAVVDDLVASGLRVVPVCPYVARWLPKHPEYAEHVTNPRPEHLAAVQTRQG